MLQDELVRVATTEREAAASPRSVTLRRGEGGVDQEKQRLDQRVSAGPQAALLAPYKRIREGGWRKLGEDPL